MTTALATIMSQDIGSSACSLDLATCTDEERDSVFNAMTNPDYAISDFVNKEINIANVLIEGTEMPDEDTGEFLKTPRVVLIDTEGKSYQALSKGIFNSIKNACVAYGAPPWKDGLKFTVLSQQVGRGRMFTLARSKAN